MKPFPPLLSIGVPAAFLACLIASASIDLTRRPCEVQAQPLPQPPGESPEPPLAVAPIAAEPLSPSEERLFARIRSRIDQRVEERVNANVEAAFVDAASEKRGGLGSVIAAACLTLVKKIVAGLIVGAVVSVLLGYWWILAVLLVLVAVVGYGSGSIGGRRAAKG